MWKKTLDKLFNFVEEPDLRKAYDLLMDAIGVDLSSGVDEETGDFFYEFPEGKVMPKVILNRDHDRITTVDASAEELNRWEEDLGSAIRETVRKAQSRIREIIEDGTEIINFDLKDVMIFSAQHEGKLSTNFYLRGGRYMKPDDIVFAFVTLVEQSDYGRCRKCGKLFIGTRKGIKKSCSSSCKAAFSQQKIRDAEKIKRGGRILK
jgi:hypothetical protein